MDVFCNTTNETAVSFELYKVARVFWDYSVMLSFVFGFPGVLAIFFSMFQKARKGTKFTPNDVYMLNLAVMDGIYLLTLIIETYNKESHAVFALFINFLSSFGVCGRPLFTTFISLDCYLAVVHPVTFRAKNGLTPRFLASAAVWIATVLNGYYFISTPLKKLDLTHVLFIILTLPIIGFCDCSILWNLRKSSSGKRAIHPQKKRALHIIINNTVLTLISHLPLLIFFLVSWLNLLKDIVCFLMISTMSVTVVGLSASNLLYLDNLGKLDWLKCWEQK